MKLTHSIVAAEEGVYHGWPANHGGWQSGEEILVGFLRGPYKAWLGGNFGHNIAQPFEYCIARSLDNGRTWATEACPDFAKFQGEGEPIAYDKHKIYRFGGDFDHGGIDSTMGNVWASADFGRTWEGPYTINGPWEDNDDYWCTTRTCMVGDLAFLSHGRGGWGNDATYCARYVGDRLEFVSYVCMDEYRAVMPSVTVTKNGMFCALRRRSTSYNWVEVFRSVDEGKSWKSAGRVGDAKGHNGNPPALVSIGRRLHCFYASRGDYALEMATSCDDGETWDLDVLRMTSVTDVGYPKAFVTGDNEILLTYYWKDVFEEQQYIAATRIEL